MPVSIAQRALLGDLTFFGIKWYMESIEGSPVRTVKRCLLILQTFRGISEPTMWEPGAMPAQNVARPLQPALD